MENQKYETYFVEGSKNLIKSDILWGSSRGYGLNRRVGQDCNILNNVLFKHDIRRKNNFYLSEWHDRTYICYKRIKKGSIA